jgi:hypothetical protein
MTLSPIEPGSGTLVDSARAIQYGIVLDATILRLTELANVSVEEHPSYRRIALPATGRRETLGSSPRLTIFFIYKFIYPESSCPGLTRASCAVGASVRYALA